LLGATLSHALLDAFTCCDYGVAFLAPIVSERFHSPWRPLPDAPDDPTWYVSAVAFRILGTELVDIGLPCLIAYLLTSTAQWIRRPVTLVAASVDSKRIES
jgi:hypothetical protein